MCFPSLQQNVSPLVLLPEYIGVLGKKIDMAERIKDLVLHGFRYDVSTITPCNLKLGGTYASILEGET